MSKTEQWRADIEAARDLRRKAEQELLVAEERYRAARSALIDAEISEGQAVRRMPS